METFCLSYVQCVADIILSFYGHFQITYLWCSYTNPSIFSFT